MVNSAETCLSVLAYQRCIMMKSTGKLEENIRDVDGRARLDGEGEREKRESEEQQLPFSTTMPGESI